MNQMMGKRLAPLDMPGGWWRVRAKNALDQFSPMPPPLERPDRGPAEDL